MARRIPVDLYCEDRGHELFVVTLIRRLAAEESIEIDLKTRNSRGGHGRAVTELKAWQRTVAQSEASRHPDLLVLVIDGNCSGWNEAHKELEKAVDSGIFPKHVIGCPDPHIERWCLADPDAFQKVIGSTVPSDPGKCDRGIYKRLLRESILESGQPILTTEMEFASDLVRTMDFYKVGKIRTSDR